MAEIKAKMSDLFKDGDNFQFKKVDYSSKKMAKKIKKLQKLRDKLMKETQVDWSSPHLHKPFDI